MTPVQWKMVEDLTRAKFPRTSTQAKIADSLWDRGPDAELPAWEAKRLVEIHGAYRKGLEMRRAFNRDRVAQAQGNLRGVSKWAKGR